jgi:hypothetical protein
MNEFTSRFGSNIKAVLSGFDRIVLTGVIRHLCCPRGVDMYLRDTGVLIKNFGEHMIQVSEQIRDQSIAQLKSSGAEYQYLQSCNVSKEDIARRVAAEKQISSGHVCAIGCVESCKSFIVRGNRVTKHIEVAASERRCLHIYSYRIHPIFGWMNIRLQTWFPFRIQICMNGREWLARQLDQAGIAYYKADNCFPWIEDFQRAQQLVEEQLSTNWEPLLNDLVPEIHPFHPTIRQRCHADYYWSCRASEWATDVVFAERKVLEPLTKNLLHHGIATLKSPDTLRFLARTDVNHVKGDVNSTLKFRHEGARVKHWHNNNSVKMYDKATSDRGSVLRFELTMNNEECFKIYRAKEGGPINDKAMRSLRRGMVDFESRAQVSQQSLDRYMDAMASAENDQRLSELLEKVTKKAFHKHQPVRALRPFSPDDTKLLEVVSRAEFSIQGLRNRDLHKHFFKGTASAADEAKRRSGWITRKLRLLNAHGIILKTKGSNVYQVTEEGRKIMTAVLTAKETPVNKLIAMAA